jgi:hypothetical protein
MKAIRFTLKEVFENSFEDLDSEHEEETAHGGRDPFLYGAEPLADDPMYDKDGLHDEEDYDPEMESYKGVLQWAEREGITGLTKQDLLDAADFWDVQVHDLGPENIRIALSASPKERSDKSKARAQRISGYERRRG